MIPGSVAFWEEHISPLQARWYDLVKLCGQILEEHDARRLQHVTQQNNKYQVLLYYNQSCNSRTMVYCSFDSCIIDTVTTSDDLLLS